MATAPSAALLGTAGPRAGPAPATSSFPLRRPLDEESWRARLPRGQVYLIANRCKGCRMCVEFCPQQVLTLSEGINAKGYHFPVVAPGKQDACVACGFCSLICPEFAIFAVEAPLAAETGAAPAGQEARP